MIFLWPAVSMTPLAGVTYSYNFDWIQIHTLKNPVPDPIRHYPTVALQTSDEQCQ
jgi:hypothetical protein